MLFVAIGQLSAGGRDDASTLLRLSRGLPSGVTLLAAFEVANSSTQLIALLDTASVLDLRRVVSAWAEHARFVVSPAIQVWPANLHERMSGVEPRLAQMAARANHLSEGSRAHELDGTTGAEPIRMTPRGGDGTLSIRGDVHNGIASAGQLTRRELEILRLMSLGRHNREIAAALFISIRTVERHNANLYRKLNISSRSEAVAWWYRRELTSQSA